MRTPPSTSIRPFAPAHASVASVFACWACLACGGEKPAEAPAPAGPIVSVLELPIALRSQGTAPSDGALVEVSQTGVNVRNQPVLTLAGGTVNAADRAGGAGGEGGLLPKLVQAISGGPHAKALLAVASTVPYETVTQVLASAKAAGAESVVFQVRAPSGTTPGYLALDGFDLHPKTKRDEGTPITGIPTRPWSDFSNQWEVVAQACGGARTGSCAFKPEKIADGGELKIVLHAAGQGVNVEFFRIGPLPEESAPDAKPEKGKPEKGKKGKKTKGKKKPELIDGVPAQKDVVDEVENALPASEALFQFRAQEAVSAPSPITETIKPVCGTTACGVVVQAEKATQFVRVISLVAAAFPDGTTAPRVVFELP